MRKAEDIQAELDAHEGDHARARSVHLTRMTEISQLPSPNEAEKAEALGLSEDLERLDAKYVARGTELQEELALA